MTTTALLIIDIQNDYFPGGRMELTGATEASQQAQRILDDFRKKSLPIYHVQHISTRQGATFFIPNTDGVHIHENVKPLPNEPIIKKNYPNSFRDTDLLARLQESKITNLVICGMMTHMCIDTTVRAAADLGFDCTLIHDACATRNLQFAEKTIPAEQVHLSYLAALNGLFAKVITTEQYLDQQTQ